MPRRSQARGSLAMIDEDDEPGFEGQDDDGLPSGYGPYGMQGGQGATARRPPADMADMLTGSGRASLQRLEDVPNLTGLQARHL